MNFEEVYEAYFDKIFYKINNMVKNEHDAEDIIQEVFLSVYKNINKFKRESSIYTWIYKIAINKTFDFFRKNKNTLLFKEELSIDIEDIKQYGINEKILIGEKLSKLSLNVKNIIILHDIYGYKFGEISKFMDMKLSNIKSIYYSGMKEISEG